MKTETATDCKNEAMFVGTVVAKYFAQENKKVLIIVLAVKDSSAKTNYPRIAFYGSNAKTVDEAITASGKEHPHIIVKASIETNKKIREGQPVYYQNIVGRSAEIAPTQLDAFIGKTGTAYIDDVNRVSMIGEVVHLFQMGKTVTEPDRNYGCIITLKTYDANGRFHFPKLICFKRNAETIKDIAVGDKVAAVANIQTKPKAEVKGNDATESIVCSDVAILQKQEIKK